MKSCTLLYTMQQDQTQPQPTKPAMNLDYLAPTLSAIFAGCIHHVCSKNQELKMVDLLLILSPSLPVICQVIMKMVTLLLNTTLLTLSSSCDLSNVLGILQLFKSDVKGKGLDADGSPIYEHFSTTMTPAEKMVEWQQKGYFISIKQLIGPNHDGSFWVGIIYNVTKITSSKLAHFHHEFKIGDDTACIYVLDNKIFIASTNQKYLYSENIYNALWPTVYSENRSKYRISRIHNQCSQEIFETIKKYKTKGADSNVILNFMFAGPPGTCKTFAARAIAKELYRTLVEIDLKTINTEPEFFAIFEKYKPTTHVFLMDEIDLMCPTRQYDDAIIAKQLSDRMKSVITTTTGSGSGSESDSDTVSLNDMSANNLNIKTELRELREKLDKLLSFQDWLKTSVLHAINLMYLIMINSGQISQSFFSKLFMYEANVSVTTTFTQKYGTQMQTYINDYSGNNTIINNASNENSIQPKPPIPFTLRTMLTFISGGTTPDGLCICATTNRPEMIDPALVRPGRLRLMKFENLRVQDAVAMIHDEYPDSDMDLIRNELNRVGYTNHQISGALLSALIASTVNIAQLMTLFERELKQLG